MKNISISRKLIILLALPFFGLLVYSAISAKQSYQQWRNLTQTEALMKLAISAGDLAHQLQRERGATSGFVQSKGEKFAQELPGYRADTDKASAMFKEECRQVNAAAAPDSFRAAVEAIISKLDGLKDKRDAASKFTVSAPEAVGQYTRIVVELLDLLPMIARQTDNVQIGARVALYRQFLGAKERAGQERAMMTGVFVANKIDLTQYSALLDHINTQRVLLGQFKETATDEEIAFYTSKLTGAVVDEVEAMRKTVMNKVTEGDFGIEPTKWFAAATVRINALRDVENMVAAHITALAGDLAQKGRTALIINLGITFAAISLTVILGIWIIRSIIGSIGALHQTIVRVQSNNDLTQRVAVSGRDEIAQAGEAFNLLMGSMQGIIHNVTQGAEQVRSGASQVSAATGKVTNGSQSQSEAAAAMAAAMEQMTVSIDQVAEHASEAQKTSTQSGELSMRGGQVIMQVVNDMRLIAETVNRSSGIIQYLGRQSDEIYSIVQVIKGVADQTNLLALNAAIEAARAGEQGRGFAVVADEVRKLAESTTHSTQVIAGVIDKIRDGTKDAVSSMEVCVNQVNQGVELAGQAGEAITQISAGAQQVNNVVSDISSAIREQSIAITDVARNVERVAQMADGNYSIAQEAANAVRHLENLAEELEGTVERFKA